MAFRTTLAETPAYVLIAHSSPSHLFSFSTPPTDIIGKLTSPQAAPVAIGAIATLYDVTSLAFLSADTASSIPNIASQQPLTNSLVPNSPLTIPGLGSFPILGFHFFAWNGTPVFNLNTVGEVLFSKKLADIKAPANANAGIEGTGAVDWLALTAIGGSVGLKQVFRVDTAGGNPPASCAGYREGQVISVPYSAGYHFYG
jgi:hypothetical protein